jgi:putative salt-induced outer membrane protein YdiY
MAHSKPEWYTNDHDSLWERTKSAFKNDWEQTKHDFGSDTARDLDQDVDDTVKQAAGTDDAFENHEQAFRFGHAAQLNFRKRYPSWGEELDHQLRSDYHGNYDSDRAYIRHAYEYPY